MHGRAHVDPAVPGPLERFILFSPELPRHQEKGVSFVSDVFLLSQER